jgi:serine/threonine protein kinase
MESGIHRTRMEGGRGAAQQSANAHRFPLPEGLVKLGYSIMERLPATGAQADCFLLQNEAEEIAFAKIYRHGLFPKASILQKLEGADPDHVVKMIAFDAGEESGEAWELLEYVEFGTLADFIEDQEGEPVDDAKLRLILKELTTALEHIHDLEIEHRDIKPENILIKDEETFDLVLTDFGIASEDTGVGRFTEMGHNSVLYSPPGAETGHLYNGAGDFWALGMIMVELIKGVHPFLEGATASEGINSRDDERAIRFAKAILRTGDQLVTGIEDEDWLKLCRGLLRVEPQNRWGTEQVTLWLDDPKNPDLAVPDEGGRSDPGSGKGFTFAGETFHDIPSFANFLRHSPEKLKPLMQVMRDEHAPFRGWLSERHTDTLEAVVELLEAQAKEGLSMEISAAQFLYILDRSKVPMFSGVELTQKSFGEQINAAVRGDVSANGWFERFLKQKVRDDPVLSMGFPEDFAALKGRWVNAERDFGSGGTQLASRSSKQYVHKEPNIRELLLLLTSLLSTKVASSGQLREDAQAACTDKARKVAWFRNLGDPANADPTRQILLIRAAPLAEASYAESRRSLMNEVGGLWRMIALGGLGGALLGAGAVALTWGEYFAEFQLSYRSLDIVDFLFWATLLLAWGLSNYSAWYQVLEEDSNG